MLDPITALGVAGNVMQVIDFSYKLVSEGNKIYHSTNGALEENRAAEELASDLARLTSGLSESQRKWIKARGDTQLDPDETRLRNICDRCTEIAVELNVQLQKLKVQDGSNHRRLKSYKQAIVSVWRNDSVEQIATRLDKYRQELNTHILFGLRKSADEHDVKHSEQFAALTQQQKDLTVAVLDGDKKVESRLSDQAEVLARIQDNTSQILSTIEIEQRRRSPSPLPPYDAVAGAGAPVVTPLHDAAEAGDLLTVRRLLRSPTVDVNARDDYGSTPLHIASIGDVAKRLLADKRTEQNIEDYDGRSALHCAVLKRRLDVMKALLEAGIDKNLEDDRGRTAAFYARDCPTAVWLLRYGHETDVRSQDHLDNTGLIHMAWLGDIEGTKFFLSHHAHVNARNKGLETALTEAARHGDGEIVEMLINSGANLEIAAGNEWTPLQQAIRDGRPQVVQILLKYGANKEAKLKNNNTPLAEACWREEFVTARVLIEAGSNIEVVVDQTKKTPLLVAATEAQPSLVRLLLKRGAKKEVIDKEGCTAVFLAARAGHLEELKALLDSGANANMKRHDGFSPISVAAKYNRYDSVKVLLDFGADPNAPGSSGAGYSALLEASHHGHVEVVRLLLDNGGKWDVGSKSGYGAVSVAAHQGRDAVIRFLAERGANLEQPGFGHKDPELSATPLMRAAMHNYPDTITVLLELGADIDARDAKGRTALYHAALNKREECVAMLVQRGANVDIPNDKDETALMRAASTNSERMVRTLFEANASLRLKDWRGLTAWTFAVHSANDKGLQHLLNPAHDENETLHRLQAERHPSEIAAYLNQVYH